jgi:hypothetical protein
MTGLHEVGSRNDDTNELTGSTLSYSVDFVAGSVNKIVLSDPLLEWL